MKTRIDCLQLDIRSYFCSMTYYKFSNSICTYFWNIWSFTGSIYVFVYKGIETLTCTEHSSKIKRNALDALISTEGRISRKDKIINLQTAPNLFFISLHPACSKTLLFLQFKSIFLRYQEQGRSLKSKNNGSSFKS